MISSYLSENVKFLLIDIGEEYKSKVYKFPKNNYISESDLLLKWDLIENDISMLKDINLNHSCLSHDTFRNIIKKCWPIYNQACYLLNKSTEEQQEYLWFLSKWTNNAEKIEYFFNVYKEGTPESIIETVLFLSSTFERALGNIYRIKGKQVPFLLRDLLDSNELKSLLSPSFITFLQILLGHPKFLNIRNICWHGFISPNELAPEFPAILFLCIAYIGKQLENQSISLKLIPWRPQLKNFETNVKPFTNQFEKLPDITHLISSMSPSKFISKSCLSIWKRVYYHYKNEKYGQCILLLIPQIEQILRIFYCYVNNCETRILTAESTTQYITLDEILEENLPNGTSNRLVSSLCSGVITILLDIFSYSNGPRIRDKISHGEIDLDQINKSFAYTLLIVIINIIDTFDSDCFQNDDKKSLSNYKHLIWEKCSSYISCYHISSLIKNNIDNIIDNLQIWKTLEKESEELKSTEYNLNFSDKIKQLEINLKKILRINNDHYQYLIMNMNYEIARSEIYTVKIHTNFMSKRGIEFLSILKRISENIKEITNNVHLSLEQKIHLYKIRKMRSRQRESYIKILNCLPYLYQIISLILNVIFEELKIIDNFKSEIDIFFIFRSLKLILQYMENIKTFTNINTNKWGEIEVFTFKINNLFNPMEDKKE